MANKQRGDGLLNEPVMSKLRYDINSFHGDGGNFDFIDNIDLNVTSFEAGDKISYCKGGRK